MSWIDRLLRRPEPETSLTLTFPKPEPANFCWFCGEPMVEGYMVAGRQFDPQTGNPVLRVQRNRMCLTLHKRDIPAPKYEDGEMVEDPLSSHDGFHHYSPSLWGWSTTPIYDYIPDCEPPKKAAK